MKKTLALLLTVVMLFAVCIPAFAANPITQLTEQSGQTIVKTDTKNESGADGRSYAVWIPATTVIPWGKASVTLPYQVESHLTYGETLSVKVAGTGAMALKEDAAEKLAYTLSGDTAFDSGKPVVYPVAEKAVTLSIEEDAWNNAVVGEYSDVLTFTAEAK